MALCINNRRDCLFHAIPYELSGQVWYHIISYLSSSWEWNFVLPNPFYFANRDNMKSNMSKRPHMVRLAAVAVIILATALMPAMSTEVIFSITSRQTAAPPPITMITEPLVFTRAGWIYYLPGNGQPSKKLCKGEFPTISPDGKRVAFCTSGDKDDAGLVVLSLRTLKTVGLLRPGEIALNPRWSPKGNLIAFMLISVDGRRQISPTLTTRS